MISLSQSMECRMIQAMSLVGGCTSSIFPQVEAILIDSSDYQKALEFVAARKDMERYRSVMDFFFCELFQEYRRGCFKFYDNESNPMLKDILTPGEAVYYGKLLLKALEIAYGMFCEKRRINWTKYRCEVLRAAA